VKFPNLKLAMGERRVTQFMLADLLRMSDASFSRRLTGRAFFAPHEKRRIGEYLQLDPEWLFTEARIPSTARLHRSAPVQVSA
jgi:hypothetical protein